MRLKLTLEHAPNQVLPINYPYLISSWIYHTLGNADETYARRLHDMGYNFDGKKYKLFTFSPLRPKWFNVDKTRRTFTLAKSPTVLELSFYIDEAVQHFVMGLFKNQKFSLSSGRFQAKLMVSGIEMLPKPVFRNRMRFRTQTPVCISQRIGERKHATYLSPEDNGYAELLLQNLLHKQAALTPQLAGEASVVPELNSSYTFRLLSKPKSKLISIKETKIRGYLFDFELMTTKDLMKVGYFSGVGEKNSGLGFGMVKCLK